MADPMDILKLGQAQTQAFLGVMDSNMARAAELTVRGSQLEFEAAAKLYTMAEEKRMNDAKIEGLKAQNANDAVRNQIALGQLKLQQELAPLQVEKAKTDLKIANFNLIGDQFNQTAAANDYKVSSVYAGNLNNEFASKYFSLRSDTLQRIQQNPGLSQTEMAVFNSKTDALMREYSEVNPDAYKNYDPVTARNLAAFKMEGQLRQYETKNPAFIPNVKGIRALMLDPQNREQAIVKWGDMAGDKAVEESAAVMDSINGLNTDIKFAQVQLKEHEDTLGKMEESFAKAYDKESKDAIAKEASAQRARINGIMASIRAKQDEVSRSREAFITGQKIPVNTPKNEPSTALKAYEEQKAKQQERVGSMTLAEQINILEPKQASLDNTVSEFNTNLGLYKVVDGKTVPVGNLLDYYQKDAIEAIREKNVDEYGKDTGKQKLYESQHLQQAVERKLTDEPDALQSALSHVDMLQNELAKLKYPIKVLDNPYDKDVVPEQYVYQDSATGEATYDYNRGNTSEMYPRTKIFDLIKPKKGESAEETKKRAIRVLGQVTAAIALNKRYSISK